MVDHKAEPEKRIAQNLLANEVVWLLHGQESLRSVVSVKNLIFPDRKQDTPSIEGIPVSQKGSDLPSYIYALRNQGDIYSKILLSQLLVKNVVHLMVETGLAPTKTQANKLVIGGSVFYGRDPKRVTNGLNMVTLDMLEEETLLLLRVGRNVRAIHGVQPSPDDEIEESTETKSDSKPEKDKNLVAWKPTSYGRVRRARAASGGKVPRA